VVQLPEIQAPSALQVRAKALAGEAFTCTVPVLSAGRLGYHFPLTLFRSQNTQTINHKP
jgi:hypothetical protein